MSTSSSTFFAIINDVLDKRPDSLHIQEFYNAVINRANLDKKDLEYTVLKNKKTSELRWRRNLRNALQSAKKSGLLVNSSKKYWRLPSINTKALIDINKSWEDVLLSAKNAQQNKIPWYSPIDNHTYNVLEISISAISIQRMDTYGIATINKQEVINAVTSINAAGGIIGRKTLNNVIAKESAIVFLHPMLEWSDDNIYILSTLYNKVTLSTETKIYKEFGEAPNDNIHDLQFFARKVRKGQPQFRKKLLRAYNGKCCISAMGPDSVLEAAHIENHSVKGLNQTTNGLLLRSDLHNLFDDNLFLIHPKNFKLYFHPALKNSYYYKQFNGKKIRRRIDNKFPDEDKLKERWNVAVSNPSSAYSHVLDTIL